MIDYAAILTRKFVGFEWTLTGDNYDGLVWLSNSPKPSKKELDELWDSVSIELETAKTSAENKRASAFAKLEALGLNEDDLKALGF